MPVGRNAELVIDPQGGREPVCGLLLARQYGIDSAGPRARHHLHALPEARRLYVELRELRHRPDDGVDLGKHEGCLLGVGGGAVDLTSGLSLRAEQMATHQAGN